MKRVFDTPTYTTFYTHIMESQTEIEEQKSGFAGWSGHSPDPVSEVKGFDIIYKYFNSLADIQKKADPKVRAIFEGVEAADYEGAQQIQGIGQDQIDPLVNTFMGYLVCIVPNDGSAPYHSFDTMMSNMNHIDDILLRMDAASMASRLVIETMDANGNIVKTYDWEKIGTIVGQQDITQLNDMQILAVAMVMEKMTTVDKDGNVTTDWRAMTKLIELSYGEVNRFDTIGIPLIAGYDVYQITPAAQAVFEKYREETDKKIEEWGYLLPFDQTDRLTPEEQTTVNALREEMLKVGMTQALTENYNTIVTSSPDIRITSETLSNGDIQYHLQVSRGIDPVPVNSYSSRADAKIRDANLSVIESLRREHEMGPDPWYAADMAETVTTNVLSATVIGTPVAIAIDAAWITGRKALDDVMTSAEVAQHNSKVDIAVKNYELSNVYEAYNMRGVTYTNLNGKSGGYVVPNMTELEIRARAYGTTGSELLANSNDPSQTKAYSGWFRSDKGNQAYEGYKLGLRDTLKENPQFSNKQLEDLTPAEIGELDKKYNDATYDLKPLN